ncbi:MAG TPA: hypothetical protein VN920_16950 [Pyrinomonadaceae bacterium]|nr:hypothetical protein [Pyrinomonadaceae bacterium]
MTRILKTPVDCGVILVLVSLMLSLLGSTVSLARGAGQKRIRAEDETPVFNDYRGVQIGMTADEARKKLGHPRDKGDTQDFFVFSDNETAQIVYDTGHKVVTVSVDFLNGAAGVPVARAVVGSDVEVKPDGSMYKMVRYPKAGCWVSYSRTAGDSPLISITLQKIE